MKHDGAHPDVSIRTQTLDNETIIHLEGRLCFATVPVAYEQTKNCFGGQRQVRVDLGDIQRTDSAALALVLEWRRLSKQTGTVLILQNIPPMLKNIAHVSDLDEQLLA